MVPVRLVRRPDGPWGKDVVVLRLARLVALFRVVLAVSDKTMPTLICCIDQCLRRFGGVPTYAFYENVPRNIFIVLWPVALCGR